MQHIFKQYSEAYLEGQATALAGGQLSHNKYGMLKAANGTRAEKDRAKNARDWAEGFESVEVESDEDITEQL